MPPRRRNTESKKKTTSVKGVIEGAGEVVEQPITDTLEKNYMPYAMSVIMSRAIPEIDGFKPSHRKLGCLVLQEQNQPILWDKP